MSWPAFVLACICPGLQMSPHGLQMSQPANVRPANVLACICPGLQMSPHGLQMSRPAYVRPANVPACICPACKCLACKCPLTACKCPGLQVSGLQMSRPAYVRPANVQACICPACKCPGLQLTWLANVWPANVRLQMSGLHLGGEQTAGLHMAASTCPHAILNIELWLFLFFCLQVLWLASESDNCGPLHFPIFLIPHFPIFGKK